MSRTRNLLLAAVLLSSTTAFAGDTPDPSSKGEAAAMQPPAKAETEFISPSCWPSLVHLPFLGWAFGKSPSDRGFCSALVSPALLRRTLLRLTSNFGINSLRGV